MGAASWDVVEAVIRSQKMMTRYRGLIGTYTYVVVVGFWGAQEEERAVEKGFEGGSERGKSDRVKPKNVREFKFSEYR